MFRCVIKILAFAGIAYHTVLTNIFHVPHQGMENCVWSVHQDTSGTHQLGHKRGFQPRGKYGRVWLVGQHHLVRGHPAVRNFPCTLETAALITSLLGNFFGLLCHL